MPTFNPPLARDTSVPITSSDHDRYVHLSFTLLFEPGEDASGSWELWTDIPNVDNKGDLTTGPGEWRAVTFESRQTTNGHVKQDSSKAIDKDGMMVLPSTPVTPPSLPLDPTLLAEMVVPAHNAHFSYTYRRVHESGDTQWLGNGGDNGIVRVFENDTASPQIQQKEWKGVGIELKDDESAPITHHLPAKEAIKASILLLQSVPPTVPPVYHVLETSEKGALAKPESLVIASSDLRPVSIQPNSTSPVSAGLQEHFDKHRSLSDLLIDACHGSDLIKIATDSTKEITTFLYCPKSRPDSAFLVVHAPVLEHDQTFKPTLPALKGDAPLVLRINGSGKPTSIDQDSASDFTLCLPAGTISTVIEISQSINYPNEEGADFWICAPDAKSQKVEYKVIQEDKAGVTDAKANSQPEDSSDAGDQEPIAHVDQGPAPSIHDVPELVADDGDSIKSSDSTVGRTSDTATLLSWMKRFFLSFWSWFFGPSVSRSSTSGRGQNDNAEPASGTVTPNERTHLLASPQTSAATSSTAVSPFTSPASGKADLIKTLSNDSDDVNSKTAQIAHVDHSPTPGSTETKKAYASFVFTQSPVHLLFAPGIYEKISARLRFQYRYKQSAPSETQWLEPKVKVCDEEDGADIKIDTEGQEQRDGLWELQMEMI